MSLQVDTVSQVVAPTFQRTIGEGETITVKDILELAGVSKVTLLKLIDASGIKPVGKIVSGGRGRPAFLFDRGEVQNMLDARSAGKLAKSKPSKTVLPNDTADAVAEPDSDDNVDPDLALALAAQQE
jgi:hypothetical protein